jgi:ribosome biogenesis GTPase
MAKRRLTERQKERIQAIQQKRCDRATERAKQKEHKLSSTLGTEQSGRIISHHGASLIVEAEDGELYRCVQRQNMEPLVCGDNIIWQASEDSEKREGVIVALQPRHSLLERPGFDGETKPVAANIDQIIVVSAIQPALSEQLIDRYLINAETVGIPPILLINKTDLLTEGEQQQLEQRLQLYQEIGYQLIFASVKLEHGLDPLIQQLQHRTSILVGQSGTGKSSLVKQLLPEQEIRIGDLSDTALGKHTTTTSVLYHLPNGGDLIDSPGVRDFGVWHIEPTQIAWGFIEFRPFLGKCKFSNCCHTSEPGCAIKQAIKDGNITARRLKNYHHMVQQAENSQAPDY